MNKCIATSLLALLLTLLFTACGGEMNKPANGTYASDDGFLSQSWTFSGDDKITLSMGFISSDGTYYVEDGTLYVTSEMLGSETTSSYTITEITGDSFFIDGTKFIKQ